MNDTPEAQRPENSEPQQEETPRPVEETEAEPYDATASDEPTVDTTASGAGASEDPEAVVPGDHTWAMACHLAIFANFFCFAGIVIPLLIRESKRKEDPEVEYHAKEALNFQLNVVPLVLLLLFLGLASGSCVLFAPAILGLPVLVVAASGFAVIGAVKASEGRRYRYPVIKRFLD